jgi:DNA-binding IclR family transcriptional regulator
MTARSAGSTRVQSVERAVALLRAVATASGSDASATALAQTVGLNRTTTWRILSTLEHHRLVAFDKEAGTYSLGFELIDLAGQAAGAALVDASRAVLNRLAAASGETAALAVLQDGALTYVAEASAGSVVAVAWKGRAVSMHATSTGKVLLAYSHPDDLRTLLGLPTGGRLRRHTPTTITSLTALRRELAVVRERGYADCRGEFESLAWGVSAPVLDAAGRPVAVVSIWGPGERVTPDRFPALGTLAIEGAAQIARRVSPPPTARKEN